MRMWMWIISTHINMRRADLILLLGFHLDLRSRYYISQLECSMARRLRHYLLRWAGRKCFHWCDLNWPPIHTIFLIANVCRLRAEPFWLLCSVHVRRCHVWLKWSVHTSSDTRLQYVIVTINKFEFPMESHALCAFVAESRCVSFFVSIHRCLFETTYRPTQSIQAQLQFSRI